MSADLRVDIFADSGDETVIGSLAAHPAIKGFTTNPTLLRSAGVTNYEAFARRVLAQVPGRPISFEVFADEFDEMERQARRIATWGDNVYVKVPVTDADGEPSAPLLRRLAGDGIRLNVTALFTLEQVARAAECLAEAPAAFISVFAGRVADTGRDPVPLMQQAVQILAPYPNLRLIWASAREILNVVQADQVGCDIITLTPDLIAKLPLLGKDPAEFSLETVRMFRRDARMAELEL